MSEPNENQRAISHYRIVSKIGAGGMGEVYRARDTRLDREVAIKLLPAEVSSDPDRLKRFEQEARATSALNHPNILTVYDIGTHEGSPYIVAELLEGEELRDRLDAGTIPLRKAVDYAQQIVSGLSAAHEKGITHRDLKPENLFITNDERVKILDFGLAKLRANASEPQGSEDATRKAITNPGVVMGTVGYMSPEQVRGQVADYRSDIFSFGAILHEMLSGRRAFRRETMAETMAAILKEEPEELAATNPNINPSLERIVQRCLEKKPERRFHSSHDLGFALESLSAPTGSSGNTMTTAATTALIETSGAVWRARLPWLAFAVAATVAIVASFFAFKNSRRTGDEAGAVRFNISHGQRTTGFGQIAISPDGRNLVMSAINEGKPQLWLRPLDSFTARVLPGTENIAGFPFWSPDSRSIAFATGGKLRKIDLADGTVQSLCDIPVGDRRGFDGTWNRDGTILFFVGGSTIFRVAAAGGKPEPIPGMDQPRQDVLFRWPQFLPDGKHFLYLVTTAQQGTSEVFVATLDGKEPKRLLTAQSSARYAGSPNGGGYLLFARDGALLAQPFDAQNLTLAGDSVRIADQLRVNSNSRAFFSVSDNGILVYDQFADSDSRQLTWFDRAGKQLEAFGEKGSFIRIKLSPDQKRAAVSRRDPPTGVFDLYVVDVVRGATTRLTSGTFDVSDFVWSPDSNYIAWVSARGSTYQLLRKLASGSGQEEVLLESSKLIGPTDWSADGKFILYTDLDPKSRRDIWVLPLEGDRKPYVFFQTPADDLQAVFSPDGRWIAYVSGESGNREIYVQTFPASGGKWPVSTNGGLMPIWRRDGKELFYMTPDGKLMAVEIKTGSTFEPGVPKPLFDVATARTVATNAYDVSTDGQRFLFTSGQLDTNPSSLAVILNWTAELKK
jgi:Tol biopolymer transport system component